MTLAHRASSSPSRAQAPTGRATTLLFAAATGVIVVNLFASQTLIGPIAAAFRLGDGAAGLVSMATLLGYAAGLFLLVPLADLIENRALVVAMLAAALLAAVAAAAATVAGAFLAMLFVLGAACSAIQILLPMAASLAPPEQRGRVVGDVASGMMTGIVLSRPCAGFIADLASWRAFYAVSAAALGLAILVVAFALPKRQPHLRASYPALLASLWQLIRTEPVLRQRALTAALAMAAFSAFWTTVALRLAMAPFHLGQSGIALFALAGASGAVAAPVAGRAGDRGFARGTLVLCHALIVVAFGLAACFGALDVHPSRGLLAGLLAGLAIGAVLLDFGVVGDQTLGRRAVNLLRPEARGRVNALFVGLFFLGGAVGSAVAGVAWALGGWVAVCAGGAGFGALALLVDRLGARSRRRRMAA